MEPNNVDRYATFEDYRNNVPLAVVWELTLACNLSCKHCGSRAGKVRQHELTLEECFEVIERLKGLGTREIGIIGGEAFLRKDWLQIVQKITLEGIDCSMQTGGFNFTENQIVQAKNAGIKNIGVSLDGLEEIHNFIRGKPTSYAHAVNCLNILKKHNIPSSVNTTITSINKHQLERLLDILIDLGVKNWQLQFAVAMGNAVDNDELLIQPYETKVIVDRIAALYTKGLANDLLIQAGNNIGFFGPHEHKLRAGNFGHYVGCSAGQTSMGIEADGTIKGCPSLPTADYSGGNVRDKRLQDIWDQAEELAFTRKRRSSELWGFCRSCYYSSICLAGCSWTSHVLFGKRGNNPYCYHRVVELEKQQKREVLKKVDNAGGLPFDYGRFQIVIQSQDGVELGVEIPEAIEGEPNDSSVRSISMLHLCKGCFNYIFPDTSYCAFCNADVHLVEEEYKINLKQAMIVAEEITSLLALSQ
ncbi:radical SAM protein [Segetibacter sp. 3557_3]|uniref:radical SAM/SPASM domain-containing protein n=1 Tax=Segetibacter sp. 3557_3 TaxID=2547429 RepID=UPI0010585114|nr:radical SAM protein [Segetibacter sp. 3557_3]TDH18452.1 radical SAM protein [Segetibacter sp. 3557_3]